MFIWYVDQFDDQMTFYLQIYVSTLGHNQTKYFLLIQNCSKVVRILSPGHIAHVVSSEVTVINTV